MRKLIFLAILVMLTLVMACSKEDSPQVKGRIIDYTVSVNKPSTKATISGEKSQVFEDGDVLHITGVDISGTLDIISGVGEQNAVFSGELEYTGQGDPDENLVLNATLIGPEDKLSTGNYSDAVVPTLADAVQEYSALTGSSTYGQRSFYLTQGSTFINFRIIAGGLNGEYTVILSDDTTPSLVSDQLSIADGDAFFTIALPGGTTLQNPMITIKSGEDIVWTRKFGSASTTLPAGKLSTVTDKIQLGDVFYSDGTWGNYKNVRTGERTPVGLIVYVNEGASSKHPATLTGSDDIISFADGVTEKSHHFGHALVIALADCPSTDAGVVWSTSGSAVNNSVFEKKWLDSKTTTSERNEMMFTSYDGIGKTEYMRSHSSTFLVAEVLDMYADANPTVHSSGWFLPTISQWMASFYGLGGYTGTTFIYPMNNTTYYSDVYNTFNDWAGTGGFQMLRDANIQNAYEQIGGKNYNFYYYWSSTQNLSQRALTIAFDSVQGLGLAHQVKDRTLNDGTHYMMGRSVRGFLAF